MRTTTRALVTVAAIAGLALGAAGFAQPRAAHRDPVRPMPGSMRPQLGLLRPHPGAVGVTLPGTFAPGLAVLRGAVMPLAWNPAAWPIGTTIELRFFDADPAEGAEARATLGLTVGVDSEVAFAQAVAAALADAETWEAAYLVVGVGETRRVMALPGSEETAGPRAAGLHALRLATAGMAVGDSVTVAFYDADPAQGAVARVTLSFTYGVDSEIGFRAALAEAADAAAAADGAFVEVVTSPRSRTVDLKAVQARRAATWDRFEAARERMGDLAERLTGAPSVRRHRTTGSRP